jgi:peptidoglycan/LPS O-acetylase OafA/YrhL
MITGFLFFSKLLDGRSRGIDWFKLYISRFLRLVPLYLFAMLLLFLIVAYVSEGNLYVPLPQLLKEMAQWIGFTVLGAPNLNSLNQTAVVVAGVTWSLPYEWFFYFSLPLLALTVRVVPPLPFLAIGLASLAGLLFWHPGLIHLLSFLGGIASAFLVRSNKFCTFSAGIISSLIALLCIASAILFYPSADAFVPLFLLSVAFALIACGNDLFGLLTNAVSRTLGEMAYSIYLLHGLTLFSVFYFFIGYSRAGSLSVFEHWLLVVGITPVLVLVSYGTFRFIENPSMHSTKRVATWLRSRVAVFRAE